MIELEVKAKGRLRLLMVLNLSRFVGTHETQGGAKPSLTGKERELFNHLRGSPSFLEALHQWSPQSPFERDLEQDRIEEEGYRLRVFRSRLRQTQFLPTYRLNWTPELCSQIQPQDPQLLNEWVSWGPRLRFTPYGLATVTLERQVDLENVIDWTEKLLEIQREQCFGGDTNSPEQQVQWWISRLVLTTFLESVGWKLVVNVNGVNQTIHFQMPFQENRPLRLDRYVLYLWDHVTGPRGEIDAYELKTNYKQMLAGVLEGSLLVEDGKKQYPTYPPDHPGLNDLSSWEEELCLLTGETGLIYTPLVQSGVALFSGSHWGAQDAYANYWAAVVRGIEHLVAFRAEAERTQRRTVELLGMVPRLTQGVNDGQISRKDEEQIAALAGGLSDIFDTLPEQRSMAISAIFFRADYARRKFETLMERLDIPRILEQVDTNVEQLSYFLEYYNGMRLQWQSQRVNTLAWRGAIVLLFMAVSSFLNDALQVFDRWNQKIGFFTVKGWTWLTLSLIACLVLFWRIEDERIRRNK